jgi:tripartite-type tricarboxylate transporter receptor subunit TctC
MSRLYGRPCAVLCCAPARRAATGIVAPAHTPPEIVRRLSQELRTIIDSSEIKSTLGKVGFEAFSSSPPEFEDFIKVQLKWGKMAKDASIQPE